MMKAPTALILLSLLALISLASSFGPLLPTNEPLRTTAVPKASKLDVAIHTKTAVLSAVTAAFFAASVASLPAMALDDNSNDIFFGGSSQVIAARSGGRAGGRVSSGGASYSRSPSSSYSSYRSSTTIIRPVAPPTVIVTPPVTYGYSYNPFGGFGLGYTVGAIGNIGNEIQDIRQESEIQRSKVELEQARMKEAELEGRLRALEAQQASK